MVEHTLAGGTANRGRVSRVGDTVRRPLRPSSPATRALLDHLHAVGFDGAPRWLGVDEHGRETLTFVPGEAPIAPYAAWALSDAALASVGTLLRRFHDAAQGFPALDWNWHRDVPAPYRTAMISHNDPNLDNVVFRDGRAVALIDFDLAGAGSRVWDVAMAARLWCPLRDDADIHDERRGRTLHRLALLLDAYGASQEIRRQLPDALLANHSWAYDHVRAEVRRGHAAFTDHWVRRQARERADRTWQWLHRRHGDLMRTAATLT